MVGEAREHHALCLRSCDMMKLYVDEWPLFYYQRWEEYDEKTKDALKRWYGYIHTTAASASEQKQKGYSDIINRSVIYLADVLENLTETFLQVCLTYIDNNVIDMMHLTGRKSRNKLDARDIKRSVRKWERSFPEQRRLDRFCKMIATFFPSFDFPEPARRNLEDLIEFRNKLTHELIVISPTASWGEPFRPNVKITNDKAESFFDDTGNYILALMDAFRACAE